jgi:alkylation response protein AidB-like acyl-CoA dehydrogenase
MDFTPTEEQEAVRGLAATLLATATDAETALAGFDTALWSRMVDAGLLGVALPESIGGGGLGLAEATAIAEEVGRAAARVPAVPVLTAVSVLASASSARLCELAAAAAGGQALTVPGLDEPLQAARDGEGWVLSGSLLAVPWAGEASHLIVAADGLLAVLPTDGVLRHDETVSSYEPHATVVLDGVRVAADDVLAEGADAVTAARTTLTLLRCAHALGVAETALKLAAEHVSQREQFGRPLATFQAVTYRVADCWIDVEAMRLTLQQAVWRVDNGLPALEETDVAAFWAAEGAHRVTSSAVHLHGGLGVDVSYPLHRWFLAAKVDELALGGAQRRLEHLGDLLAAR